MVGKISPFESLVVLHCKLIPGNSSSVSSVFRSIKDKLFSFRPETCARQIFIFYNLTEAQKEWLTEIQERLLPQLASCEIITGFDAYEFLIQWASGLLNPKHDYNDRFVLGKVRQYWTNFCALESDSIRVQELAKIIPVMLEDAHLVRRAMGTQCISLMETVTRLDKMQDLCKKYRLLREQNIAPRVSQASSFWSQHSREWTC